MQASKNNQVRIQLPAGASQVDRACKAVLRCIWSNGLKAGDRIPNHRDFARETGLSNSSLVPAMRRLTEAGVIVRKPRVGSVVLDPDAYKEPLWRVAVIENFSNLRTASFYYSLLGACVQHELMRNGCWPRLYLPGKPRTKPMENIDVYPSLVHDVRKSLLDGAVALGSFDSSSWRAVAQDVPLCGFDEYIGFGAVIDWFGVTRAAVEILAQDKCRRIAVVDNEYHIRNGVVREAFRQSLTDLGLWYADDQSCIVARKISSPLWGAKGCLQAGRDIAGELLARPSSHRPDGLIILDDFVASSLINVLRDTKKYRPGIAVLTHVQNPIEYALPVRRFELDIAELARCGVEVLMERLKSPALPNRIVKVPARCGD